MQMRVVVLNAMIIGMAKINAVIRGSNVNNGRMSRKEIQEIKPRDLVYFLKKDASRMISSSSTQVPLSRNVEVFTA
jgi:hypothetical protein